MADPSSGKLNSNKDDDPFGLFDTFKAKESTSGGTPVLEKSKDDDIFGGLEMPTVKIKSPPPV